MATRRTVVEYDGMVELSERAVRALETWRAARAEIEKMEVVRDAARSVIEEEMGEAEAATAEGEVVVTWIKGERTNVDVKRLRADLGAALAPYTVTTPTRTFKEA